MTTFWAWFVAVGTIVFIVWATWLVSWSSRQGPQDREDDELVGHTWDGDLEEWNHPAPKWWLYLYFITIIWGVGYMLVYPGLAAYQGALGWSQEDQYAAEMRAAAERYDPIYERYAGMEFEALAAHPDARDLGASLYASYCTTCHGSDARGAPGFPNLTDDDWLWGGTEQAITASIANGRNGIMTPWASVLGAEGVDNMVRYVRSLSGLDAADGAAMSAQPMFTTVCAACHMADGTGNPAFGAPNLRDDIWLYGSSAEAIRATIAEGRHGVMPAHGELLGEHRTKILAAYVYGLSQEARVE